MDLARDSTRSGDQSAIALARLLKGEREVLADFEARAAGADEAAWSDLAAARYELATGEADLLSALAAADHALQLNPQSARAWLNRGVILSALRLRPFAVASWKRCVAVSDDALLTSAAHEWLRGAAESEVDRWNRNKGLVRQAIERNDDQATAAIVGAAPQHARLEAEGLALAQWGAAYGTESSNADLALRWARAIGAALERRSGEQFLLDSVSAIDRAEGKGTAANLAAAHVLYKTARVNYKGRDYAAAERDFRASEAAFLRDGSPMALMASSYLGRTLVDENRPEEAALVLDGLLGRIGASGRRYRALAASIQYELGVCNGVRGFWDDALQNAKAAVDGYSSSGETANAGDAEALVAEILDYLGDDPGAWSHRRTAFDLLTAGGDDSRLRVALAGASRAEMLHRRWKTAASLLGIEIEAARLGKPDLPLLIDALSRRSRVLEELGQRSAAQADIRNARAVLAMVLDRSLHTKLTADLDAAEANVEKGTNAQRSIDLLSSAIAFYQSSKRAIILPELYLGRGRVRLVTDDVPGALADFTAGIEQLEKQRGTVSDADLRGGIFDVGEALFTETIGLLANANRWDEAFAYAERSRARTMTEVRAARQQQAVARVASVPELQAQLAPGAVVVVLHQLPDRVAAMRITRDDAIGKTLVVDRKRLEAEIDAFQEAIAEEKPKSETQKRGAALFDQLLRPLGIGDAGALIVIANKSLQRIPFAALYDAQRSAYLAEDVPVLLAPSASVLVEASRHDAASGDGSRALLIGNPRFSTTRFGNLDDLPSAEREVRAVASVYRDAVVRTGSSATRREWNAKAPGSDVIQFSGHAIANGPQPDDALLLLAEDGDDAGALHAREIAAMSLPRTRLVVLAGCGTSAGDTSHVEGARSIASAFLMAGAPVVVGTLWDIGDDAADPFVVAFHRGLASGRSPLAALHEAQLNALRGALPGTANPRVWAAFQLYGGARETIVAKR